METLKKFFQTSYFFLVVLLSGITSMPLFAHDNDTSPLQSSSFDFLREDQIKIVYPVVMAPYAFEDDKGKAQGLVIDLLRLWSKKTGIPVKFISAPWNEGLQMMKKGQADIYASLYYTENRETYLNYAVVVSSSQGNIFHHKKYV